MGRKTVTRNPHTRQMSHKNQGLVDKSAVTHDGHFSFSLGKSHRGRTHTLPPGPSPDRGKRMTQINYAGALHTAYFAYICTPHNRG